MGQRSIVVGVAGGMGAVSPPKNRNPRSLRFGAPSVRTRKSVQEFFLVQLIELINTDSANFSRMDISNKRTAEVHARIFRSFVEENAIGAVLY